MAEKLEFPIDAGSFLNSYEAIKNLRNTSGVGKIEKEPTVMQVRATKST